MPKPILCLDFDGVVHQYTSGWHGACTIVDDATPGFFEWLDEAAQYFDIQIFSSRSHEAGAVTAMQFWLAEQRKKWRDAGGRSCITDGTPVSVSFPTTKPPAMISIDDRALLFRGSWDELDPQALLAFRPWNKPVNTESK